jgi:hypothetical protein
MRFRDSFSESRRAGHVIGTRVNGVARGGLDKESALSIDNGALRIQPLLQAGWQRACLSYGPVERTGGLVFAVYMLNGHNTAQAETLGQPFGDRLRTWLLGSQTVRVRRRLWRWLRSGRIRRVLRQVRWWKSLDGPAPLRLDENLAVGWFSAEVTDPSRTGASLVMHATGPENGELWARCSAGFGAVVREVQNLPLYYLIVLRERDVIYYAGATIPGARGLPAYPHVRPIAIGPLPDGDTLWASIHQSVLGQIGFRCDTRVYATAVAELPDYRNRFGGAVFADSLEGAGPISCVAPETGGGWNELVGTLVRTDRGVTASGVGVAVATTATPPGLIRAHLRVANGRAGIWFRSAGAGDHWEVIRDAARFELAIVKRGERIIVAVDDTKQDESCELQIVDDGQTLALLAGARLLFDRRFEDSRLADMSGIGITIDGSLSAGPWISNVETQPRELALPGSIDLGGPRFRFGTQVVIADDFSGPAGSLGGHMTTVGGQRWKRRLGAGEFDLTGDGSARVRADRVRPCPGRTVYTIDWHQPDFADVEVTITPPGSGRGNRDFGLVGFVLWQDEDNYVSINTWLSDSYPGASTSSFFTVGGWEDLYDAIWSNVGERIRHGVPCRFRVVFDGLTYVIFIDDVAVLYRKLTDVYADCKPFSIREIGLLANWEWGLDTGSRFQAFRGRI